MPSLLIADSGSTKTDWCLLAKNRAPRHFRTQGLNPFFTTEKACFRLLEKELDIDPSKEPIGKLIFYGAGIKDERRSEFLKTIFRKHFHTTKIEVYSDLLAAARSTCGNEKGVVCILGTGSNSGFYDGKQMIIQNPSLGYIIGDEGSGAYLGKRVLQYFFYKTFDDELYAAFHNKYGGDLSEILDKVYHQPQGNRYLAAFTQFLIDQRGHYMVENIIEDAFIDFHQRHILKYRESWQYPIHFCGTVAYEFRDILLELQAQYGLETGRIIKDPKNGLIRFHNEGV